jgi:uncharacterized protein involved in exopolysaccharide biosynthesis
VPPQESLESNAHVQSVVQAALTATAKESDTVKAAAASAAAATAAGAIPAPGAATTNILWVILVSVLGLVVLGAAIAIIVYALENKASPPDILVTVFTTALSGIIGLFVKPPSSP